MSEYVFRYASGYGSDMGALMDGGRVTVGDYFASESTDHYGTLHEEIVRCRDCKYYELVPEDSGYWCEYWTDRVYRADGFCAWGERRGEGESE